MKDQKIDGLEIDQILLDSLDIGDKYNLSEGKYDHLPLYERREKAAEELYSKYPHIIVSSDDKLYGLHEGQYEFIKDVKGLYNEVLNSGKI